MLYLATGGLGFLATPVVRKLVEGGHRVRVLDDWSRGISRLDDLAHGKWRADTGYDLPSVELIRGDVRNRQHVEWAVGGTHGTSTVDSVLHFAAVNGTANFYKEPGRVLEVAVKGIVNLIDVCKERGVKEFVLVSSSEVYQTPDVIPTPEDVPLSIPDPKNPRYSYAAGKIISELMCLWCGGFERLLVVRPHNVVGPWARQDHVVPQFINRISKLECISCHFPIQGTGAETRAFCYIDDFVSGFLKVLEKGKHREVYNIGTDNEVAIETLAKMIGELFQVKLDIKPGVLQEGGTLRRCPDVSKLRALGWEPQVSLQEGLRRTVDWHRGRLQCNCGEDAGGEPSLPHKKGCPKA